MSITGGIKFFDLTRARLGLATAAASTGNSSASAVLDGNIYTMWESVGSNDATTETLTITFSPAITINRLLLANLNWKDFNIQYNNGSGYTHFAAVVGLDGSLANITETAFADSAAYYEFTQVAGITAIRCQVLKTQVVDAQKNLFRFFAFSELGTFIGFPKVATTKHSRNERVKKTASEKFKVQKSFRASEFGLSFVSYPTELVYRADLTLVETLFDREEPFGVWLCGGRRGENYFRHSPIGWNLKDILTMDIVDGYNPVFREGLYIGGVNANIKLVEVVP